MLANPLLLDLFLELCAISSPSGKERAVADRVGAYLAELGLAWDEDDAGARLDGNTGNIYCRLPATNGEGTPIFLCAHTDTVPPEAKIEPVVAEGIVRNAAGTILGSDNKAGRTPGSSSSSRRRRRFHCAVPTRSTTRGSSQGPATSTTRARRSVRS